MSCDSVATMQDGDCVRRQESPLRKRWGDVGRKIDGAVEVDSNRGAMEAELCGDNQTCDMLLPAMKGRLFPNMLPQWCQVTATEIPDSFVQSSNGLSGYSAAVSASVT